MIDKPRLVFWLRFFTLASLALVMTGCAEELGPEQMRVTRVKGKVNENGRPVGGGWIEFFPIDGAVGTLCSARLRPDGSFEAGRVAVGMNQIRLVNASVAQPRIANYFFGLSSRIRRTIPERPGSPLVIDLVNELKLDPRYNQSNRDSERPGDRR